MTIKLENGRVFAVEGDHDHPVSTGHICPKGRAVPELLRSPDRLQYPVSKTPSGTWKKISWDEAYSRIVRDLKDIKKKYGPEALAVHVGHAGVGKEFLPYVERFCALYGTPNFSTCGSHCFESKSMANIATFGAMPIADYGRSRCIVLWGKNPGSSAPSLVNEITEAKRKGCSLVVIDPRVTQLAEKANLHLQPRPGTDGALALGFLHVIIEEELYDSIHRKKFRRLPGCPRALCGRRPGYMDWRRPPVFQSGWRSSSTQTVFRLHAVLLRFRQSQAISISPAVPYLWMKRSFPICN
jgi:anaerobic selenocysteine-containing dehydrogenase